MKVAVGEQTARFCRRQRSARRGKAAAFENLLTFSLKFRDMSETANIPSLVPPLLGVRARGYRQSREVETRAAVTEHRDSPQMRRALAKLDRVLEPDQPLKSQVPRGFYLNIVV
jgi:hypothetical protein